MKKRVIALILAAVFVAGLTPALYAASDDAQETAEALFTLGLFLGTDKGFELDRAPKRQEAVTILVRLLGKEKEATTGNWSHPFDDVQPWAESYVGYAYANGLTMGVESSSFGSANFVNATQFLTFILRALGYVSEDDFQWDRAWELSDSIGLTHGQYDENSVFLRADAALLSFAALTTENKQGIKLIDCLIEEGAVSREAAESLGLAIAGTEYTYEDFVSLWQLSYGIGTIWICQDSVHPGAKQALETFTSIGEEKLSEYTLRYMVELYSYILQPNFQLYFMSQQKLLWAANFDFANPNCSIDMNEINKMLS